MLAGVPYRAGDPELQADQAAAEAWMVRYNAALGAPVGDRRILLRELFGAVGDGAVVRPPFHCDYGYNIRLGADVFLNFNCVILDVVAVTIGAGTQIGPAVQIYTADHPRDPAQRRSGLEFGRPVVIGANAWIGGGAIILPGVNRRRRRRDRRRQRRHPRRAGRRHRLWQPGANCSNTRIEVRTIVK